MWEEGAGTREGECGRRGRGNEKNATTYYYRHSVLTRCQSIPNSSLRVSGWGAGMRGECGRREWGNVEEC